MNNFGVNGQVGSLGRILAEIDSTNNSTSSNEPKPKTNAQIFMKNLIYGITAFLAIVALVLLIYAIYLLCVHCQQNRKVVIGGVEYYASPPSIAGSETSRDLIALRDSDLSAKKRVGGKVLQ
jgi:hypothetical protein